VSGTYTFAASNLNLAHTHWTVAQYLLDQEDPELRHCIEELVVGSRLSQQPDPKRSGSTALRDAAAAAFSLGRDATASPDGQVRTSVRFPRYVLTSRKREQMARAAEWRRHSGTTIPSALTLIASSLQLRDLTTCTDTAAQMAAREVEDPGQEGPPSRNAARTLLLHLLAKAGDDPEATAGAVDEIFAVGLRASTARYNLACNAARQADFLARSGRDPSSTEQVQIDAGALSRLEHVLLHSAVDRRDRLVIAARSDVAFQGLAFRRGEAFRRIVPPLPPVLKAGSAAEQAKLDAAAAEQTAVDEARRSTAHDIVMRWANPERGSQEAFEGMLQRLKEAYAQMGLAGASARHAALVRGDEEIVRRLRRWWEEDLPDDADRPLIIATASRALFITQAKMTELVERPSAT
jgi:hypothetical protein